MLSCFRYFTVEDVLASQDIIRDFSLWPHSSTKILLLIDIVLLLIFRRYFRVLIVHFIVSLSIFSSFTVKENSSANQSILPMYRTASLISSGRKYPIAPSKASRAMF